MAIQVRRGNYADFDPDKMLPGEWATATSGDPNADDGMAVYMCFKAGKVKRMATYDDMKQNIEDATSDVADDVAEQLEENINEAIQLAQSASSAANSAAEKANSASQLAQSASSAANSAASAAQEAAQEAQNAADNVKNDFYGARSSFPVTGETKKLYVDNTVNPALAYIWNGSDYIPVGGGGEFTWSGTTILMQSQQVPKSFRRLKVYGKSTQNGTPSPESPAPIVSAGDNGEINVSVSDGGTQSQTLTLSTPNGLPGIPVESGGNYTDASGQQWIADVKDYGTGKYTQNCATVVFDGSEDERWTFDASSGRIYSNKIVGSIKVPISDNSKAKMICSAYEVVSSNSTYLKKEGISVQATISPGILYVYDSEFTTAESFTEFLQSNPMTLLYQLSTPIVTDISAEEMEAYKALKTYTPTTVISSDSGVWMEADLVDSDILYPHAENTSYDNSTSGLTADNVQEAIDENAAAIGALNSRGTYIFKSGDVAAVHGQNVNIATIELTAGHTYLVLAEADSSASVSMTSVTIQTISGTADRYGLGTARTTGNSGGGCAVWVIAKCKTDATLAVQGYGFDDADYNYRGHIVAIRLN